MRRFSAPSNRLWWFLNNTESALKKNWFLLIQSWTLLAQRLYIFAQKHCKNIEINSCNVFFPIAGDILVFFTFFCSSKKSSDMESKENTDFGKIKFFEFFRITHQKLFWNFDFSSLQHHYSKKPLVLAFFMVFACLLLASNVQRWIRDVQKCSSLNQLWPKMLKLKSTGSALNIAENAKISESALKMTEYLWELNPVSH